MTSYTSIPALPTLSPTNFYSEDQQPIRDQLDNVYTDIANVTNDKARRYNYQIMLDNENITNDLWVDGDTIFNKVIATGTITAGATNNIPHGIDTIDILVNIRVMVTDGTTQRLLGYANPTAANSAAVDVDATDVIITTGAGFGAGFEGYVYMEYTKI